MGRVSLECVIIGLLCVSSIMTRPMKEPKHPEPVEGNSPDDTNSTLEYDYYLRQVVEALESDPDFRKKLESANVSDIKSGKIAMHLEMVNHTIRTSLDEIKRREIARLQELARMQIRGMNGKGMPNFNLPTGHLDVKNPHSFEMKDLEHLIKKTTSDLEKLDEQRKEEFKEYEMEKAYEKNEHLKELSPEEKKKEEERLADLKKKHQEHPKLHHPGSKDQFKEVWDEEDHLKDQEFNPKTFFFTHDLNGDMEWSIDEVDAVLQHELDKVYSEKKSPEEDDPLERNEEMNRMREHVFKEMDKDKNFRISFQEFIDYTGKQGENEHFNEDEESWKPIGEEEDPMFSDDEYDEWLKEHHAQPGVIDPPHDNLQFKPEHDINQQQQHQGGQQHQQQQPPQHQQQQPPQHQQQPPQHQQQPPQHQQQQFQQAGQQAAGSQHQQQQPVVNNMNQQMPSDPQELQRQLKELQEKLAQQQQHH